MLESNREGELNKIDCEGDKLGIGILCGGVWDFDWQNEVHEWVS